MGHHLQEVANLMKGLIIFSFLLFLYGCQVSEKNPQLVPLVALLGFPEKFDGNDVIFTGFLGRGSDVYLTKEHSDINDRSSSLFLSLDEKEREVLLKSGCTQRYVEVIGSFGLVKVSGLAPRLGITDVKSVTDKFTNVDCNKELGSN